MQIFPLIDPYSVHYNTYAGNLYTLSTDSVTLTAGTLTAANLVTAGDLTLGQYIYHQGDLDTYIQFTDDRIDNYVKGVQAFYTYWTGVLNIIETHFVGSILKIDDTTYLQCDGPSFFDGQATVTATPQGTTAVEASLYVNPASATNNYALFGVALNGSGRFLIDEDGDIGIYSGWIYRLGDSNTSIDWYAADSWKLTVGGTDMAVFVENTTSSTIKFYGITSIGDGGATNYSKFELDGTLEFNGNATVWNDANVGISYFSLPVASQPDEDEFVNELGADTGITTYAFAVDEHVSGSIEIPHDYKEGSDITFHVHWQGIAAPTGTDYVKWQLTYTVVDYEQTLDAATVIYVETAFDTQYEFKISSFTAITGTNFDIGMQFLFDLKRITADGDAYAGDALVATVGLHYECDTVGSRQILDK